MQLLYWFSQMRVPFLNGFFSALTHLGSETLFMVIAIIVFWCVDKYEGYYLLSSGFFGTVLNQFLKLFCKVPRPWVRDPNFTIVESARTDAGGYSFPSGHTQNVVSTLGGVARAHKTLWLRIVCIVLILLTAISRMYLGVHTPWDVGFSLVVTTLFVFGLYPLFRDVKEKPRRVFVFFGVLIACTLAFIGYVELTKWPADIDADNLQEGVKNAYVLFGASVGMLVGFCANRKKLNFNEKAPIVAQILKTVLGLILLVAIRAGTKPLFQALLHGHAFANALRYFTMVIFATIVWPLTFPWFEKGCPLSKKARKALRIVLIVLLVIVLLAGIAFWVVTRDTKAAPIETDNASNPFITKLGTTMLSGHRAGAGIAPENTMMAIKLCLENESFTPDVMEFDLHMTADGVLVLLHDETLDRTSNAVEYFGHENVNVGDHSFEELKALNMGEMFTTEDGEMPYAGLRGDEIPMDLRITSLDEALSYLEANGQFSYIIEIKNGGEVGMRAADELYHSLNANGCLDRAIIGTFNNEITDYMGKTYPDMKRSAGVNECINFYVRSLLGLKAPKEGFGFVALQIPTTDYIINLGTSRVVNYAHKNNLAVQYWTINDPSEMARLQAIGADCIMTDLPDVASQILNQP